METLTLFANSLPGPMEIMHIKAVLTVAAESIGAAMALFTIYLIFFYKKPHKVEKEA